MTSADLKTWLTRHSETQTSFAKLTDYNRVTVNKWCNGVEKIPTIVELFCLSYTQMTEWRDVVAELEAQRKDQKG